MPIQTLLRSSRSERGLSLRALQERCGVDAGALSRYESGAKIPRADTVETIAAALGYELELRPSRTGNQRFVDALCRLQAEAVAEDQGLLEEARDALRRLEGRSVSHEAWRALLEAGTAAVISVLTSDSPHARALKADSPLALVVQVEPEVRARLAEAARDAR